MDAGEVVGLNKLKDQQQRRSERYLQSNEVAAADGEPGSSDSLNRRHTERMYWIAERGAVAAP